MRESVEIEKEDMNEREDEKMVGKCSKRAATDTPPRVHTFTLAKSEKKVLESQILPRFAFPSLNLSSSPSSSTSNSSQKQNDTTTFCS